MQRDYTDKKIVIVGAGATGCSLARFFRARGAQVALSDNRSADRLNSIDELHRLDVALDLGGHNHSLFTAADLIVVSHLRPNDILEMMTLWGR